MEIVTKRRECIRVDCRNISGKHEAVYLETSLGISVCAKVLLHGGVGPELSFLLTTCLCFKRRQGKGCRYNWTLLDPAGIKGNTGSKGEDVPKADNLHTYGII